MSNTLALLKERRQAIIDIAAKHGVYNVRVFGSVVRNEDRPDSDIDLLVSRGEKVSSWFPAGLVLELEKELGRNVDVVTDKRLNPRLREYVLKEAVSL